MNFLKTPTRRLRDCYLGGNWKKGIGLVCVCVGGLEVALLAGGHAALDDYRLGAVRELSAEELADHSIFDELAAANANHNQIGIFYDAPGVVAAELLDAAEAKLQDEEEVIGIRVRGRACAFSVRRLYNDHIVNLTIDDKPVSLTYCGLSGCARVFTGDGTEPIPLMVGGLDVDRCLVLKLRDSYYGQSSKKLSLQDQPFEQVTWAAWKSLHPSTKVWF